MCTSNLEIFRELRVESALFEKIEKLPTQGRREKRGKNAEKQEFKISTRQTSICRENAVCETDETSTRRGFSRSNVDEERENDEIAFI